MTADFPVSLLFLLGAVAVPFLRGHWRAGLMLLLPVAAGLWMLSLPHGDYARFTVFGQELVLMRVDRLSLLFGYVFALAAFLGAVFSLHLRDVTQQAAALVYAGSALGAVFAGDMLSFFIHIEIAAVSSVLLIWARGGERARSAGMRYLLAHLASGMLFLCGALLHAADGNSLQFSRMELQSLGSYLILASLGIKCAFPLLHNWLQDAYPEATATGTVVLSAFTTKLGVYALARMFPGTELLIWVGTAMAAFPIFYAVIENDLRRVLAYSMNNQIGFMVVGVGIGTELALNGAVAHAFADIIFKALLFMSMGAVLLRTGTVKGSELGGLYKSMPWTTGFCMVGAASISAFPLFSGFVTKSMIMSAVALEGYALVWCVLLFASAGVFHHAGIKIPYFAFFAHDSGIRCKEAPLNMLVAMAIAAALCIGIGTMPGVLYGLLPYPTSYEPYTASHVLDQLQLLVFSALAFAVLMRTGIYPPELKSVNLDSDWTYRRLAPAVLTFAGSNFAVVGRVCRKAIYGLAAWMWSQFAQRAWVAAQFRNGPSTAGMALWVMSMLLAYLVTYYIL